MNYNWIKETNWEENLEGNLKIMADIIGIDLLINLFEKFSKSYVYFSEKELFKLKKEYVLKYQNLRASSIAKTLNTSETFVFKTIRERNDNEVSKKSGLNTKLEKYPELDLSL